MQTAWNKTHVSVVDALQIVHHVFTEIQNLGPTNAYINAKWLMNTVTRVNAYAIMVTLETQNNNAKSDHHHHHQKNTINNKDQMIIKNHHINLEAVIHQRNLRCRHFCSGGPTSHTYPTVMIILSLPLTCIVLQVLCQNQITARERHANVFEVECYDQSDCSTPGWTCDNYYCKPPSCGPCEQLNRKGKCKSICSTGQQCVKDKCVTIKKKSYDCKQDRDCTPGYACVYYECVRKDNNICDKCSIYNGKYCELACNKGGEYCNPEVGCVCEYGLIRNSSGLCSPENPEEYKPDDIPVPVVRKHKNEYPPEPHTHGNQYPPTPPTIQYPPARPQNTGRYPPEQPQHTDRYPPETPQHSDRYPPEIPPHADRYPPETTPPANQYPPELPKRTDRYPPERPQHTDRYPPEPTPPANQYPPEPTQPAERYPPPAKPTKPECFYDDQCTLGHKCLDYECIPECISDDHCFPGKRCIQYRCECSNNEQCGDGFYCNRRDYRCYESKTKTTPSPPKQQKPKPIKQCPVCEALDHSGRCVYQCDYHGNEVCDDVQTKQCICRPGYTRDSNEKCVRERSKPTRPRNKRPRNKRPRKQTKETSPTRPERKQRQREDNKINWKRNIKMVWDQTSRRKPSKRGFVGRDELPAEDLWKIPELKI